MKLSAVPLVVAALAATSATSSSATTTTVELEDQTNLRSRSLYAQKSVSRPKIPQILWFNHNANFFVTKEPADLYENVMKTVTSYRTLWDNAMAPANFIHDAMCIDVIKRNVPDLLPYWREETDHNTKLNLCRVGVLYQFGGYAPKFELEVVKPFHAYATTKFVAVTGCNGDCIIPAFIASSAKHPVLKATLQYVLDAYQSGNDVDTTLLVAEAMGMAVNALDDEEERGKVQLLEEIVLDVGDEVILYPHVERQVGYGNCNYVIRNPDEDTVNFFMGYVGTPRCMPIDSVPTSLVESNTSEGPSIPQTLWFTYGSKLLAEQTPQAEYENVLHTISKYKGLWKNAGAPVTMLDDEGCIHKIRVVQPDLLKYFEMETIGSIKGDICSIAAVYLHGGYYIDVDMQVVEPFQPHPSTDFVSTLGCNGGCFFRSFFASRPNNPILKGALERMVKVYESGDDTTMLGALTMANSYFETDVGDRGDVELLQELQLDAGPNPKHYPYVARQEGTGNCNYVIHEPEKEEIYFFARYLGYGGCQPLETADDLTLGY